MSELVETNIDDTILASIIDYVWHGVFGGGPDMICAPGELDESQLIDSAVSIKGVWNGSCVFSCDESLGRRITALMFGSETDEVSIDDVKDAMGEVANVLGGQIKALVPEGSNISLPVVCITPGKGLTFPGSSPIAELHGRFCGETFRFVVSTISPS